MAIVPQVPGCTMGPCFPVPMSYALTFINLAFSPGEKAKLAQVGQTPSRKSAADTNTQPLVSRRASATPTPVVSGEYSAAASSGPIL
jgi:hypothetical protein